MTRQEAINFIKSKEFGYDVFDAISNEQWGVAASLILSYSKDAQDIILADALWEGKK